MRLPASPLADIGMLRILIVILSLLFGVVPLSTVRAHAVLMSTEPADGVMLPATPKRIVLRFNEPVTPIAVRLIDSTGTSVIDAHDVRTLDHEVEVIPPSSLADGTYLLSYRVTSADSHPVAGSIQFSVGASAESSRTTVGDPAGSTDWMPLVAFNRSLLLTAVLVAAGGSFFIAVVARGRERDREALRPLIGTAAVVVIATATAAIGLQGTLLSGAPISTFLDPTSWRLGLMSTRSLQSLALVAGCGLILGGLRRRGPHAWLLSAGALAMAASFALSGHMSAATPRWAMLPALVIHVAIAAFWLGSLLPLLTVLRRNEPGGTGQVRRFSTLATLAVPTLIGAGVVMGSAWIDDLAALVKTGYGNLLLAKATLVAVLVGMAAINRFRLLPHLSGQFSKTAPRLRGMIKAEIAVGLSIILATVALSQTPHHDTSEHGGVRRHDRRHAEAASRTVVIPQRGRLAIMQVKTMPTAEHRIDVSIVNEQGERENMASEATLFLSHPALGIEPTRRQMAHDAPATFSYQGPALILPGYWTVRADVLFGTYDLTSFETTIRLP